MVTVIGVCAGEIWRYLDIHSGQASLQALQGGIDTPGDNLYMAIGWLGREGYILIEGEFPDLMIYLNPSPPSKRLKVLKEGRLVLEEAPVTPTWVKTDGVKKAA